MTAHNTCWCGNNHLLDFSPDYFLCNNCGTLVLRNWPEGDVTNVQDANELYGKDYYLKHVIQDYGFPSLETRARADMTERILYWADTLLRYKLPPANILELGSAHGGFVALLRQSGFNSIGLELSPWLVEFSKELFDISVYQGPLENQNIETGSLDVIVLMDVIEHLPDPAATMSKALSLLKPNGILLIQTPCYVEGASYADIVEKKLYFSNHLKPMEHLYLFSKRSIQEFFNRLGAPHVIFEKAIFEAYDMFLLVSRQPFETVSEEQRDAALASQPNGRFVLALLELYKRATFYEHHANLRAELLKRAETDLIAHQNGLAENARVIEQLKEEINRLNNQSARALLKASMQKLLNRLHF
jgi:2-polyprenyl-3-methyl-5-hydroxy-6-metoxy-1,4-benzoquinol methylase